MKKPLFKRVVTLLLALMMSFSGMSFNARTVKADSSSTWEKVTDIAAAAASGKQVAITMTASSNGTTYVLPAAATSSAPVAVVAEKNGNELVVNGTGDYGWTIATTDDGYTITNGNGDHLYLINNNNGVRVGSNSSASYVWTIASGYLSAKDTAGNTRYLGVYKTNPDWRCYTNTTGNIASQTLEFWTLAEGATPEEPIAQLDKFTTAPENNAKVVIYYPEDGLALTANAAGSKLAGVAATFEGDKLNQLPSMAYLTVTKDSNGYYTFTTEDGKVLTATVGNSTGLTFADAASDLSLWTLEQQADGTWYIVSVNAVYDNKQQYLEYYNGFTVYGFQDSSVAAYKFDFYGVQGETPVETYTVTVKDSNQGAVTVSDNEVEAGSDILITVTPEDGCELISLMINNVEHIDDLDSEGKMTFTVNENIVIRAQFKDSAELTRHITVVPSEHGVIYPDFYVVENDQDITIYVEPEEGYELTNLYLRYSDVNGDHEIDLLHPESGNPYRPYEEDGKTVYYVTIDWDVELEGVFSPIVVTHTVTVQQPAEGGTVSVDKTEVAHGETVVITTAPAEGYILDKLLVNGVETAVDAEGKATVTVTADITVTATFKVKPSDNPPVTYDTWELLTDINELQDGDCVIIVNDANSKALSTNYNGYYNAGEDVTIVDDKVTNATETMVWTVGITTGTDGSKIYTFSTAEGK
ncbi:MAG: RICIN domain-containing protein, partial [Erysipelotrichaceae bacterium]|nr:RICIN domain-containing protein [Erysipelotrichaceae bacterium]